MDAVKTFFQRQFRRQESEVEPQAVQVVEPVVDLTDATVVFVVEINKNEMTFPAWAIGENPMQLGRDNESNGEEIQCTVCPASRFHPATDSDSDPRNGKFIFIKLSSGVAHSTLTKWLTDNWRGTQKDAGIICLHKFSDYDILLPLWFRKACEATNPNIHPLRTVFLSTGWTRKNCREMYKMEYEWIRNAKEEIRSDPDYAKAIRGEPLFARMMNEATVIATVNLLFAPDL